ncbi:MAG: PVC-type heme-binding CxxCH protein [Verrucomicrobiales bacterium]
MRGSGAVRTLVGSPVDGRSRGKGSKATFRASLTAMAVWTASALAVSVGEKSNDPSPEAEQATFEVHEQFEINLFADESLGIANPIAMHWDDRGRLWVLITLTYAQLEPGENPNDKLFVLEDTDGDGKADKSTVFADGLDMPMGFALGYGGVYLGEGADLLFLKDTDGDDKADVREVVLTGFGTGDTHQNISNFTWGPDGCLYFAQGLHCFSRVETPWGIVRGDTAGFWRFHPKLLRLEPFCFPSLASQNPCGIAFDRTGAMFLKSNSKELIYTTPGLIPTTHQKNLVPVGSVGETPGKSMGAEYVESEHLPDWLQHHVLVAGYYSHRVTAFPLVEDGAGYRRVEPLELMAAGHSSFRPVEIKIGPDGAIYVADWFNPIIGHYQASLRHPDRDKQHGRVWRITAKGRKLNDLDSWSRPDEIPIVDFPGMSEIEALVAGDDARERLDGVVASANLPEAESLKLALRTLDRPRDRFIDYALEQTVHALAPQWVPAVEDGRMTFDDPRHLAYALSTLGGERALGIARTKLADETLSTESRSLLAEVVARAGGPEDLLAVLESHGGSASVLGAMAEGWTSRKVRPAEGFVAILRERLDGNSGESLATAIRLARFWKVKSLAPRIRKFAEDDAASVPVRGEALVALADLEGGASFGLLEDLFRSGPDALKPRLAEALVAADAARAAALVASVAGSDDCPVPVGSLMAPFLQRAAALGHFVEALAGMDLPLAAAEAMMTALSHMGRNEEALLDVLQEATGTPAGARAYSPDLVAELVEEVEAHGDPGSGEEIYGRAQLTCVACHQLDGVGGIIGPSLDAVGAGLTLDLLVESVLWPQRQLKEGYFAIAVTTKGGETFSGYREKEEDGVLHLRDTASGEVKMIPRVEISKLENVGSLMPPGLTNSLSSEELRDLVAYLASLRG